MNKLKTKLPLEEVTYSRSYQESRTLPVVFLGASRWIKDLELLLEDRWKAIHCVPTEAEMRSQIETHAPRIVLVELASVPQGETRLFDTVIPKDCKKFLVSPESGDALALKRLQKKYASYGVVTMELSADASVAATELSNLFEELLSAGILNQDEDGMVIQASYLGFQMRGTDSTLDAVCAARLSVARLLFSKFTFSIAQMESLQLLAECYSLWKQPVKPATLQLAFRRVENRLAGSPGLSLLELASRSAEMCLQGTELTEELWKTEVAKAGVGRLAQRQLARSCTEVRERLNIKNSKLRRVA